MNKHDFKYVNRGNALRRFLTWVLSLLFLVGLQYLSYRYFWRHDITTAKRYGLSAHTQRQLKHLQTPTELILVMDQKDPKTELINHDIHKLMNELCFASYQDGVPKLSLRFVNPEQSLETLEARWGSGLENSLLVVQAQRFKKLPLYTFYTDKAAEPTFGAEAAILSALLELEMPQARIVFTSGHGEMDPQSTAALQGLSLFNQDLKTSGFVSESIDILSNPEALSTANLVIIAGPRQAFTPEEAQALKRFSQKKGSAIFVFLAALRPHGLEALFEDWGLEAPEELIEETQAQNQTPEGELLLQGFAQHPLCQLIKDHKMPIITGLARPLWIQEEQETLQGLVYTSKTSFSRQVFHEGKRLAFSPDPAHIGPLCVAVWGSKPQGRHLWVVGNADFLSNQYFPKGGNALFAQQSVRHALEGPPLAAVPPKILKERPLLLTQAQLFKLALGLCVLPVLLLGAAAGCYVLRR